MDEKEEIKGDEKKEKQKGKKKNTENKCTRREKKIFEGVAITAISFLMNLTLPHTNSFP